MQYPIPPRSWITCDQGHRICFSEEGHALGEGLNSWGAKLTDWQQAEPKVGERFDHTCAKCGASWFPIRKWESADA